MVQWQIENEGGNNGCTPPLTKKNQKYKNKQGQRKAWRIPSPKN
jgi:hypothetical protein